MYEIAVKQDPYQTYILSNPDAQVRLEIVPERGGIATRWRIQGQDLFYMDEERYLDPEKSIRGGNPILFPICGNLVEDSYTIDGKTYALKQHGFARNLPWDVVDRATDAESASLTLSLESSDRTRAGYPFEFQVRYTYVFRGRSLQIQQHYENRSSSPMPFSAGFHPYFWVADKNQLALDIPAQEFTPKGETASQPFTGHFDFEQEEIDVAFYPVAGTLASFSDPRRRLKLEIEYSEAFSTLVFWAVKGKEFICLEPWSAPRNALNTGNSLVTLAPGESCDLSVEMRAIAL